MRSHPAQLFRSIHHAALRCRPTRPSCSCSWPGGHCHPLRSSSASAAHFQSFTASRRSWLTSSVAWEDTLCWSSRSARFSSPSRASWMTASRRPRFFLSPLRSLASLLCCSPRGSRSGKIENDRQPTTSARPEGGRAYRDRQSIEATWSTLPQACSATRLASSGREARHPASQT